MKIEKELKSKINYLFDILGKNNVDKMTISFYGSGDDGNMEVCSVISSKNTHDRTDVDCVINLDEPTIYDATLWELICDITDSILDKKGIDYANGQGNSGCVVYTVEGKQVDMEYLVTKDAEYSFNV